MLSELVLPLEERLSALPREVLEQPAARYRKGKPARAAGRHAGHDAASGCSSARRSPIRHITTDFSESQVELITGVHSSARRLPRASSPRSTRSSTARSATSCSGPRACLAGCPRTTRFRSAATAAPTSAARRASIAWACRIATAGACRRSPASTTTFRCPNALTNDAYFALIRNFRRHSWLLLYLFGASPAVCSTFVAGRDARARAAERGHALSAATRRRCAWDGSATRATRSLRSR